MDGTGGAAFEADVGVKDGRVTGVGRLGDAESRETIDAAGRLLKR